MSAIVQSIDECLNKAIDFVRSAQDKKGRWLGAQRSSLALVYAMGLALDNEQPESDLVQDICKFLELCAARSGGIGDYPGEPPTTYRTALVVPFLGWARPNSPAWVNAKRWLSQYGAPPMDLPLALSRWVFDASAREEVQSDPGPPGWMRKAAFLAARKHVTELTKPPNGWAPAYAGPKHGLAGLWRRARGWPPLDSLEEAAKRCDSPTDFDAAMLIYAGLRRLAKDRGACEKLLKFTDQRRQRFMFDDGSYEWITVLVADMFMSTAFGLNEVKENASQWLRKIHYEGDGWLYGRMVTTQVPDTALMLSGLLAAGLPRDDIIIKQAVSYLRDARHPTSGLWPWTYSDGMGNTRPICDAGVSGLACSALAACGEGGFGTILGAARGSLQDMQDPSGAFSTFVEVIRPNWCWVSTTCHALLGLQACGFSSGHEAVDKANKWILARQATNGLWTDGWGSRNIYGTVSALQALMGSGALAMGDPQTRQAVEWLTHSQNGDGGWGENWAGQNTDSTAEHTGLALQGICMGSSPDVCPAEKLKRGVQWLIDRQRPEGNWSPCYFANYGFGAGCANDQMPIVYALHGLTAAKKMLAQIR